jgi:hypothetical protein
MDVFTLFFLRAGKKIFLSCSKARGVVVGKGKKKRKKGGAKTQTTWV